MNKKRKMDKKAIRRGLLPYVFMALIFISIFYIFNIMNNTVHEFTYDKFMKNLESGKITELTITTRGSAYTYEVTGKLEGYNKNEIFTSRLPLSDEVMRKLVKANEQDKMKLTVRPDPESSSLLLILVNVLPIVIILGVGFWFFNRQMAGGKSSMDFGRSRAKLNTDDNKVTFKDVAG